MQSIASSAEPKIVLIRLPILSDLDRVSVLGMLSDRHRLSCSPLGNPLKSTFLKLIVSYTRKTKSDSGNYL
jgi:hypothetical protein